MKILYFFIILFSCLCVAQKEKMLIWNNERKEFVETELELPSLDNFDPKQTDAIEQNGAKESNVAKEATLGYLSKIQLKYVARYPYVMIPATIIPIIREKEAIGFVSLSFELKGYDVKTYRNIRAHSVLLKEAIFFDIYKAMRSLWDDTKDPSIDAISKRIKNCVDNFLKEKACKDVNVRYLEITRF